MTIAATFWENADRSGGPKACWPWLRGLDTSGYGGLTVGGVKRSAHRYAYELAVGPIPAGKQLDHLCRNPRCVNPAHLEPVTAWENIMRSPITLAAINARKTSCPRGHPYEVIPNGPRTARGCRRCKRDYAREYRRMRAGLVA